jgi:hypothetical protein
MGARLNRVYWRNVRNERFNFYLDEAKVRSTA